MKDSRLMTVYERPGPLSDMFVPHAAQVSLPRGRVFYRTPILISLLLAVVAVPALLQGQSTSAYFSDSELSTGDTFAAGPLDFTAAVDHADATLVAGGASENFLFTLTPIAGNLPSEYVVAAAASGDAQFCSAITSSGGAPFAFSGLAGSLASGPIDTLSPWTLALTLPSGALGVVDGMKCLLDIAFNAYQQGGAVGTEYHDAEHIKLLLTADPPPPPLIAPSTNGASGDPLGAGLAPLQDVSTTTDTTTAEATPTDPVAPPDNSPPTDIGTASSTPDISTNIDTRTGQPVIDSPLEDETTPPPADPAPDASPVP